MGGLSTDFGLDRWTFALGMYGPSSTGGRTYPLGVMGMPSPARYDVVQASPFVLYPTLAAAVRLTKWLDFGLALHLVWGRVDLSSVSFIDLGSTVCPNLEYQPCDSTVHVIADGWTATASAGVMVRPSRWFEVGVQARLPYAIPLSGSADATPPAVSSAMIGNSPATLSLAFPTVLRFGARVVVVRGTREAGDLEVDATWENWQQAQGNGISLHIDQLSAFKNINANVVHHYHDSYSIRLGGAINIPFKAAEFILRLGAFYDASSTASADTRLDIDTLDKIGVTAGIGLRWNGTTINFGYAYQIEPDRVVSDGQLRSLNGARAGASVATTGEPLPVVNNGTYHGATQIISIGLTTSWDELVKSKRVVFYADDYEPTNAPVH